MRRLCKVLEVHPSGFYAWRLNPESKRAKEDKRLLVPIKESWLESGSVYGYRKVSDDLRELGEQCGINRVHRLMRSAGIRSQTGYAKRKYKRGGVPSLVAPNHLQRQFDVQEPNRVDIKIGIGGVQIVDDDTRQCAGGVGQLAVHARTLRLGAGEHGWAAEC